MGRENHLNWMNELRKEIDCRLDSLGLATTSAVPVVEKSITPDALLAQINAARKEIEAHHPGPVVYHVLYNDLLTEPKEVSRTWVERLLSWPWHPLRRTKIVQVPSPNGIYLEETKVLIMHPAHRTHVERAFLGQQGGEK